MYYLCYSNQTEHDIVIDYIRNIGGSRSTASFFLIDFGGYMGIEKIQQTLDWIATEPCLKSETEFLDMGDQLKDIIEIYTNLLTQLPELKNAGIDIDEEILLQQVKNLNDAIQHKDMMELYDTLKYEVAETFDIYKKIQTERKQ